jgi:hypothetical protein
LPQNQNLSRARERAAGYYSEYPFALAQAVVEIPYLLVQAALYS